jgi:hypothetical protein
MRRILIIIVCAALAGCSKNEPVNSNGVMLAWCSKRNSSIWVRDSSTGLIVQIASGKYQKPVRGLGGRITYSLTSRQHRKPKAELDAGQTTGWIDGMHDCECQKGNEGLIK